MMLMCLTACLPLENDMIHDPDWDPLKILSDLAEQQLLISQAINNLTHMYHSLNIRLAKLEQHANDQIKP
jgi:hypothetical protein